MADTTSTTSTTSTADTDTTADEAPAVDTTADTDTLGDAGKAALAEERKARRDAEKQLKAMRTQLAAFEDANKSETQKATDAATAAKAEADTYRTRYEGMVVRSAITDAAVAARAIDPATVVALVRDAVTLDDDGDPVGVDKAVAALVKSKPFLFHATPAGARDAAAGTPVALNDGDALSSSLLAAVSARY